MPPDAPFCPTHRLRYTGRGVAFDVQVQLVPECHGSSDGFAYTAEDWRTDEAAEWERRDGCWWHAGQPLPGVDCTLQVEALRCPGR